MAERPYVRRLMQKTYSSSRIALTAVERPECPKCHLRMALAHTARGPSGFDIWTFDCATCEHAHIVTVAIDPMTSNLAERLG